MEYESQEDLGTEIARLKAQIRDLKADAAVERSQANRIKNCFWLGFAVPTLDALFAALIVLLFSGAPGLGIFVILLSFFALLFFFFAQAVKKGGIAGYWRAVIGFVSGCGVLLIFSTLGSIS